MRTAIQRYRFIPRVLLLASGLAVAFTIVACGQKGDLYIPQDEQTLTIAPDKKANNKPVEQ